MIKNQTWRTILLSLASNILLTGHYLVVAQTDVKNQRKDFETYLRFFPLLPCP